MIAFKSNRHALQTIIKLIHHYFLGRYHIITHMTSKSFDQGLHVFLQPD